MNPNGCVLLATSHWLVVVEVFIFNIEGFRMKLYDKIMDNIISKLLNWAFKPIEEYVELGIDLTPYGCWKPLIIAPIYCL